MPSGNVSVSGIPLQLSALLHELLTAPLGGEPTPQFGDTQSFNKFFVMFCRVWDKRMKKSWRGMACLVPGRRSTSLENRTDTRKTVRSGQQDRTMQVSARQDFGG
jgi:hypothetical protein